MKVFRRIAPLLAMITLVLATVFCTRALAQDNPFESLKSYDFQNRSSVAAIHMIVQQSIADKVKTAEIEQKLITVLEDPNATFAGKQEACRFLWIIGSGKSVPTLQKMLLDEKLSNIARYALERNQDPSAAKALRLAVGKTSSKVQIGIINSIGDRADSGAVSLLKPLASSSDNLVSEAAITALGKIGTGASYIVLKSLPKSVIVGKAMIRSAERMASLGKISQSEEIYKEFAGDKSTVLLQAEGLKGLTTIHSKLAAEYAIASLKSPDPYIQVVSAQLTVAMHDVSTTDKLIAMWPGLTPPAQNIILAGMGERREASASNIAALAAQSQDPMLRTTGIQALAKVGGLKAIPRLVAFLSFGESADKVTTHDSLASMPGVDAEAEILKIAAKGSYSDRASLMSVLADRPSAAAKSVLLESATFYEPNVVREAIKALGRVGGRQEYSGIIKLLVGSSNNPEALRDAVIAIGQRLGDHEMASEPVLAAYPGASVAGKAALIPVLTELGGERAFNILFDATISSDDEVKATAISALAESWSDMKMLPKLLPKLLRIAKADSGIVHRVQALRGYLRLLSQDDNENIPIAKKPEYISDGLAAAERPEEKIQVLGVLRDCRQEKAVIIAAKLLDDPDLFSNAADTILYLAAPQKKNNKDQAAVTGPAVTTALDKIILTTKDTTQKELAQKIKG